jgi:hypothetical protein
MYIQNGEGKTLRGMDTVVLALGAVPVEELSAKIKDKVAEVYVIGDARQPRKALQAMADAAEVPRAI